MAESAHITQLSGSWTTAIKQLARTAVDEHKGGGVLYYIAVAQKWTAADLTRFRKDVTDSLSRCGPTAPADHPRNVDYQNIDAVLRVAVERMQEHETNTAKSARARTRVATSMEE